MFIYPPKTLKGTWQKTTFLLECQISFACKYGQMNQSGKGMTNMQGVSKDSLMQTTQKDMLTSGKK